MSVGAARAPGATRSAPRWRPALAGLLAGLLLVTSSALADPPAVLAVHEGTPDLTLVTVSRYEVQPANRRVRVTVTITATNHLSDTATRRFYFERAFLAVLPGTSGFKITGSSGTPKVSISAAKPDHTLLRIDFGARLAAGKSTSLTLTFDLKDPGGAGNRDVRIGSTIVSFPVWAYGTDATPGSRVSVALPADYVVDFAVGGLAGPELDASGLAVYDSGVLDAPLDFYVYLVGDRPGAYVDRDLSIPVNGSMATLVVQSWEDDPEWGDWVSDLLERGLPALGLAIGLEWPLEDSIVVREALARSTGGYAGLFDPAEGRIDIAYYARPAVALHEAAHGWFNGALLADRWANEAFASLYGSAVGTELEVAVDDPELTVDLEAYRIPLNEWGAIGAVDSDVERYGYAASLALARLIAERAGDGVLREVWARASARVGAYQPVGGDALAPAIEGNESVAGPPDWRGLLDLLEDTAGRSFEDLWATWVIRDTDRPLLQDRAILARRVSETRRRGRGLAASAVDPGGPACLAVRHGGHAACAGLGCAGGTRGHRTGGGRARIDAPLDPAAPVRTRRRVLGRPERGRGRAGGDRQPRARDGRPHRPAGADRGAGPARHRARARSRGGAHGFRGGRPGGREQRGRDGAPGLDDRGRSRRWPRDEHRPPRRRRAPSRLRRAPSRPRSSPSIDPYADGQAHRDARRDRRDLWHLRYTRGPPGRILVRRGARRRASVTTTAVGFPRHRSANDELAAPRRGA